MKIFSHIPDFAGLALLGGLLSLALAAPVAAKQVESSARASICRDAALAAERRHNIPSGLLAAVAVVESGRANDAGADISAWPWTIHAEGKGRWHDAKSDAVASVRALKDRGVKNIDVGCMQVNLRYHPEAFEDLEGAFDPATNVEYAATFVKRLFAETRSWSRAISFYHNREPKRANAYRRKVMAAWAGERQHAVNQIRLASKPSSDIRFRTRSSQVRNLRLRPSPYISVKSGQPRIRGY
ncbi:MAG: transglycosylase SLT domain-containing protein [Minwuia sp.]|nr:transglycosylase SLT domain-containing protein [Minwuia sp.]